MVWCIHEKDHVHDGDHPGYHDQNTEQPETRH